MMKLLMIVAAICLLSACRSTKKIQTAINKKDTSVVVVMPVDSGANNDSVKLLTTTLNKIAENRIDFKTFTAKINVDYRDADEKNYNVNAFVRMYKDSAIWISINAIFGIEAMRAYITKDSVKLLDKQNKVYTSRSIDYLQDVTSLPLNLSLLQDLIIGNPIFFTNNIVSYSKNGNTLSLLSTGEWFKNLITVNEDDKALLHSKLDDVNAARNRTADLTYTDYDPKQKVLFSTKRDITVAEKNKLDIKLDFKQYDLDVPVSFPFSIPKNYRRK